MAYNKSKYVESAQKLLNQGKVAQAIAEYQQILKYEPRDQVTLMTIGELYIRQGETFQAIEYFERLAQLFVSDGFLTKAIAVYKRISKLAPEEIRPLEKLADLYVQQGVMSEARPLFLQLAELHLKNGKQPEAIALLKKLLLAEPDNLRIQVRLADLYQAMGQSNEAVEGYVSAAQRALARGDQAECERLADKALQINPKQLDALIIKARSHSSVGNSQQAADILERVPDLEKGGEPAELLLDLYLKSSNWDEATTLALKIFSNDQKNFTATQKVTEALLESGQGDRAMSMLSQIRIPMIDAGEHEGVTHLLQGLADRMPGRLEPLEWLVDTFGRTSDSFRLPDALANLGDALAANGKVDRAKEVLEQLVDRDPENDSAKRKLNDLLRKMGAKPSEPPPIPEPADLTETLQAEFPKGPAAKVRAGLQMDEAPSVAAQAAAPNKHSLDEQELDEETQKFIAQSLTDVDLFASYGLTQKAIGLLEAILRRAPMHTPTLEKLLDFVLGAGDDRRTAELAAQLEHIHGIRHDSRSSERFGELRRRFQRAAGLSDEEIAAAVAGALPQTVETRPVEPAGEIPLAEVSAVQAEEAGPEAPEIPEAEISVPETAAEPAKIEVAPAPVVEATASAPAEQAEEEVDLSDEWASLVEETQESAPQAAEVASSQVAPAEDEDLAASFLEQAISAQKVSAKPPHPTAPPSTDLPEFEIPLEAAAADSTETSFADISAEVPTEAPGPTPPPRAHASEPGKAAQELLPEEELTALPVPEHAEVASEGPEPTLELPPSVPVQESAAQPEIELDQDFELVLEPEPVVPAHEMLSQIPPPKSEPPAEKAPAAAVASGDKEFSTDDFLSDLAKEMGDLGLGELTRPEAHPVAEGAKPVASGVAQNASAAPAGDSGPLKDVFDEFRAELGEMGSEDEDLETHYNLGIAFREMGLLEEAIGEFQKVAQANDRGRVFRYSMQCCTLLGLAFMEKGQPAIAAIWYERALLTPGIDTESKLALRYDLGVAQESAGEQDAALKSFSQVYAVNIDYRDVAERIHSLQKPAR
ncbi:MAG TPA: tetratricopeptide repeat protein [Candidatus Eisenbacteria bacterium]|nr:tetratricopeptide repeat protein [Candidatus Eisenbacteria bacterium]